MMTTEMTTVPASMVTWHSVDADEADKAVSRYYNLKAVLGDVETPALLSIGIMGFVGACFSLAIFLREHASPNDFFLYKIISSCAAAQMLVLTIVRLLSGYFNCEHSYTCSFFWAHISISVMNLCADVVDFLILFLGIERTWACLLPFAFKNIDKRRLERTAVIVAFVFTGLFSVFHAFELTLRFDEQENRYRDSPSEFSESALYSVFISINTVRFYVTACAIAVVTLFSIFGFWRTAHRSLIFSKNRDKRREMDLCCLQLCTAAPVVLNHLLYAVSMRTGHYSFDQQPPSLIHANETGQLSWLLEDETLLPNAEIVGRLRRAEAFEYLKTSTNLSDALAHALQFYFYLIFCLKVRQGFLALWCRRQDNAGGCKATTVREDTPILKRNLSPSPRLWWRAKGLSKEDARIDQATCV